MQDELSIFKDKTVLVTGHTGFKGSWLTLWLLELGAKVVGYARNPVTEKDLFVVSGIGKEIIDIRGDIRNKSQLAKVFDKYQPEFVFHLAAQPLVKYSYDHPGETYEVNVMGTLNVLECLKNCDSCKVGVFVTSDKCYENKEWTWGYRENDPMGGYDPYSSSKGCCELLISSYERSFFNTSQLAAHGKVIASVRAGNVIGGGDWSPDRLIPDCIRSLEKGSPIEIRSPHAVRPWQHVLEPLSGYLLLAAKLWSQKTAFSGGWNFGPERESIVSVETITESLLACWGSGERKCIKISNPAHEANFLSLDISKAINLLGWVPKWDYQEAIEKTVDWYKQYKTANMREYSIMQIQEYYNY
nr:CDP-glucose 4,6-dehydratase [Bacillus coahuilensis]